jgi:hypothetical protein
MDHFLEATVPIWLPLFGATAMNQLMNDLLTGTM